MKYYRKTIATRNKTGYVVPIHKKGKKGNVIFMELFVLLIYKKITGNWIETDYQQSEEQSKFTKTHRLQIIFLK
jgi:hypothetical protein